MNKRLYLSRKDKKLAGVCGGIAEYLDVDPTLVRLFWVFFTFAWGTGLIIYIAAAIIMTERPAGSYVVEVSSDDTEEIMVPNDSPNSEFRNSHKEEDKENNNNLLVGLGLVLLGSFLFSKTFFNWHWLSFKLVFPGIIIAVGVYLLVNGRK
ncbi:PspC domain-containing protein [Alkaliphilus serpentinus]|nr:PspC domain-containing protein [Alkaliphilus serpentinus]